MPSDDCVTLGEHLPPSEHPHILHPSKVEDKGPIIFFYLHQRTFFHCFREREEERERNVDVRERCIDWLPPGHAWPRDQTRNLGMCPDLESEPQPFGYRTTLQPTEPHGQGKAYDQQGTETAVRFFEVTQQVVGERGLPFPQPSVLGSGAHGWPSSWHGLKNTRQPDHHKLDEFVCVDISMQRPRPSVPTGGPARTAPTPPLASLCQYLPAARRNPLQCKPLLHTRESLLFSPSYLFILALPPPCSHSSKKKRLNSRGAKKR